MPPAARPMGHSATALAGPPPGWKAPRLRTKPGRPATNSRKRKGTSQGASTRCKVDVRTDMGRHPCSISHARCCEKRLSSPSVAVFGSRSSSARTKIRAKMWPLPEASAKAFNRKQHSQSTSGPCHQQSFEPSPAKLGASSTLRAYPTMWQKERHRFCFSCGIKSWFAHLDKRTNSCGKSQDAVRPQSSAGNTTQAAMLDLSLHPLDACCL
mmetsp:Transcript_76299/g.210593  ORF Transcript_76299/g.210593 Transcript_76299/m.210593 type:complete len:211 (+) Transcript_76299:2141-2773(+)